MRGVVHQRGVGGEHSAARIGRIRPRLDHQAALLKLDDQLGREARVFGAKYDEYMAHVRDLSMRCGVYDRALPRLIMEGWLHSDKNALPSDSGVFVTEVRSTW